MSLSYMVGVKNGCEVDVFSTNKGRTNLWTTLSRLTAKLSTQSSFYFYEEVVLSIGARYGINPRRKHYNTLSYIVSRRAALPQSTLDPFATQKFFAMGMGCS